MKSPKITIKDVASRQLDGIVLLTCQADNPDLVSLLSKNQRVVLVDEDVEGVIAPRVFSENRTGGFLATKQPRIWGSQCPGVSLSLVLMTCLLRPFCRQP